jgi:hypothetical protein
VLRDWAQIQNTDGNKFEYSELFSFLRLYRGPENRELREEFIREIESTLVPDLTLELLRTPGRELNPHDVQALLPSASDVSRTCSGL